MIREYFVDYFVERPLHLANDGVRARHKTDDDSGLARILAERMREMQHLSIGAGLLHQFYSFQ